MKALNGLIAPAENQYGPLLDAPRDAVRESFERLLAQGELLEGAEFLARTGITRQALSKAIGAQRLFYVQVDGRHAYPAFYADHTLQRRQVETISKLLGEIGGGSKWLFFTSAKGSLASLESGQARSPLQALRDGDFERVKRAAAGYSPVEGGDTL